LQQLRVRSIRLLRVPRLLNCCVHGVRCPVRRLHTLSRGPVLLDGLNTVLIVPSRQVPLDSGICNVIELLKLLSRELFASIVAYLQQLPDGPVFGGYECFSVRELLDWNCVGCNGRNHVLDLRGVRGGSVLLLFGWSELPELFSRPLPSIR